jgi:[pyruvate, water dikinase]-phosphate phosphotransferase / [pyruvate, water dikinase] kinase
MSSEEPLILHVISDSLGDTAAAVADAVVSQFPDEDIRIERLSKARTIEQIEEYIEAHRRSAKPMIVFHTFATAGLRKEFIRWSDMHGIYAVDLLGPATNALSVVLDEDPSGLAGALHQTDAEYYRRIEAMEYTVNHDDGRGSDDLSEAEIVLIGVSRTSKTPLALLLATRGYRVANIPLALGMDPPSALFKIDSRRLFGLMSTASILSEIRFKRLGSAQGVAREYADPDRVQEDLDAARALMRRLGCIVVRTDNRAIEETAQEILRYYKAANNR